MKALEGLSDEHIEQLRSLPGLVATVCTSGIVQPEFAESLSNMRSLCDRSGFWSTEWRTFYAAFVALGRDSVCAHALKNNYAWILQVDADAAGFPDDALLRMLRTAFLENPEIDVLGAYSQLKSSPHLPTIDTGTGTWEPHFPGSGILEVIRTGAHFTLMKTRCLRRFGPPWYAARPVPDDRSLLMEFDNLCRRHLDGANPFAAMDDYKKLLGRARNDAAPQPGIVGEDSSFCDRLRAAGGRIFVDTSIVAGHVARRIISPSDLREKLDAHEAKVAAVCGIDET